MPQSDVLSRSLEPKPWAYAKGQRRNSLIKTCLVKRMRFFPFASLRVRMTKKRVKMTEQETPNDLLLCHPLTVSPYFLLCHPYFSFVTLFSPLSPLFLICHPIFSSVTLRRSRRVSCADSSPSLLLTRKRMRFFPFASLRVRMTEKGEQDDPHSLSPWGEAEGSPVQILRSLALPQNDKIRSSEWLRWQNSPKHNFLSAILDYSLNLSIEKSFIERLCHSTPEWYWVPRNKKTVNLELSFIKNFPYFSW